MRRVRTCRGLKPPQAAALPPQPHWCHMPATDRKPCLNACSSCNGGSALGRRWWPMRRRGLVRPARPCCASRRTPGLPTRPAAPVSNEPTAPGPAPPCSANDDDYDCKSNTDFTIRAFALALPVEPRTYYFFAAAPFSPGGTPAIRLAVSFAAGLPSPRSAGGVRAPREGARAGCMASWPA